MRDDLPLRPAFDAASGDEDRPLDLKFSRTDPVQPAHASRAWRIFSFGAMGACVLGLGLGLMTLKGRAATAPAKPAAAAEANFRAIKATYAPPDREQVARALEESKRLMASEGLSGLARASIVCFDKLSREPAYSLMDYCLALDLLGAQAYARAAGDTAPPSTYFGQGPVRRQAAVQMLIAGQTDANSRLIDTNRLVLELVTESEIAAQPAQIAVEPAAPEAPAAVAVAEVAPPPPPGPPPLAAAKPAAPPTSKPEPARVLFHAAKPTPPAYRPALRRPVRALRPEPKARLIKKPPPQPVRARKLVKKPLPPAARIAAAPVNADPSWPEILLTRLQGGEGKPDAEARTPRSDAAPPRPRARPGLL
jgi:hypothetical protein